MSDARASVGLLGAWKRPVHETLRLVELAGPDGKARLRLADYESPMGRPQSTIGPRAIVLPAARDEEVDGPEGILVALRRGPRARVVLAAGDLDAATRFHCEALGWASVEAGGVELVEGRHSDAMPAAGHLGLTHLTCPCEDLDEVLTRIETMGLEPLTRPTHVGLPGGRPGRVMLVQAPDCALYELYEIAG